MSIFEKVIVKPRRKVRCPKCRTVNLIFKEFTDVVTEFEQTTEGIDRHGIRNPGLVTRLEAYCYDCDHRWKVRGATQITDICD